MKVSAVGVTGVLWSCLVVGLSVATPYGGHWKPEPSYSSSSQGCGTKVHHITKILASTVTETSTSTSTVTSATSTSTQTVTLLSTTTSSVTTTSTSVSTSTSTVTTTSTETVATATLAQGTVTVLSPCSIDVRTRDSSPTKYTGWAWS